MNLDIYTEEMSKSIWDKAFFMDKIPGAKCVIDFGCADATLICMLGEMFPSVDFYGYDINHELLKMGLARLSKVPANVKSLYDAAGLTGLIERVKRSYKSEEICINFSSVLHEVYSSTGGLDTIQTIIKELNPKYITIRDMYFHVNDMDDNHLTELQKLTILIDKNINQPGSYTEYVNKFGYIHTWKDMLHFLMKSQWYNNGYEQELEEDYFSWNITMFKNMINNYSIIYENHYLLPYYLEKWKISPRIHTHAQFILRRNY